MSRATLRIRSVVVLLTLGGEACGAREATPARAVPALDRRVDPLAALTLPEPSPGQAAPPVLEGPLPPSSATLRALNLPKDVKLVYVTGSSGGDAVLALSDTNEVFEIRGDRVISKGRPRCPEPYWNGDSVDPVFRWAFETGSHIELRGSIARVGRSIWHEGMVATNEGGAWRCKLDRAHTVNVADAMNGTDWYVDGEIFRAFRHLTLDPPRVGSWTQEWPIWSAASDDSLWAWGGRNGDPREIRHFNGTTWESYGAPPMPEVIAMLQDEADAFWVLGDLGQTDSRKRVLARMEAGEWSFVPTPRGFDAVALATPRVRGRGSPEVWFFGSRFWQWKDGRLFEAERSMGVSASWTSSSGSLWVAGDGLVEISGASR